MSRNVRIAARALLAAVAIVAFAGLAEAQRRAVPRHPQHPPRAVVVRGQVFIGGYFYDPVFGPYPWWQRHAYPWYLPVYDNRGELRLKIEPDAAEEAAVYVDGFYAGVADDFNGFFQALPLTPGGHRVVLYLPGYRTIRQNIYLSPGGTFTIRVLMERLPAGDMSEEPEVAPPIPPPPLGSYRLPVTPERRTAPPPTPQAVRAVGFGTLDLFIQPAVAELIIDGQPWFSSEEGHFVVQIPVGTRRIQIRKPGYRTFVSDIVVRDGEIVPLNVVLIPIT
jgi:hypothetical protein